MRSVGSARKLPRYRSRVRLFIVRSHASAIHSNCELGPLCRASFRQHCSLKFKDPPGVTLFSGRNTRLRRYSVSLLANRFALQGEMRDSPPSFFHSPPRFRFTNDVRRWPRSLSLSLSRSVPPACTVLRPCVCRCTQAVVGVQPRKNCTHGGRDSPVGK